MLPWLQQAQAWLARLRQEAQEVNVRHARLQHQHMPQQLQQEQVQVPSQQQHEEQGHQAGQQSKQQALQHKQVQQAQEQPLQSVTDSLQYLTGRQQKHQQQQKKRLQWEQQQGQVPDNQHHPAAAAAGADQQHRDGELLAQAATLASLSLLARQKEYSEAVAGLGLAGLGRYPSNGGNFPGLSSEQTVAIQLMEVRVLGMERFPRCQVPLWSAACI
jgi:hypothetical protein